jgi:hypothetical protein
MKKYFARLIVVALLTTGALLWAAETEGELRVFLILTQRTGPEQLNKIVGDIGSSAPTVEAYGRKTTLVKKLPADQYTITVQNVQVCAFKDCVPCPDQSRDIGIQGGKTSDAIFRWKAKYDRADKKWVCES